MPASLVFVNVLHDVIINKVFKNVKLEVVLVVELLALLCLHKVVRFVLVAIFDDLLL